MKTRIAVLFAMIFFIGVSTVGSCAAQLEAAPLPDNIQIVPPGPDVVPELAKFSGVWIGRMYSANVRQKLDIDHVLIVESFLGGLVSMVYSQGSYVGPPEGMNTVFLGVGLRPGWWKRVRGYWDEEKKELMVNILLEEGKYKALIYKLDSHGELSGKGQYNNDDLTMRLTKKIMPIQTTPSKDRDDNDPLAP